MNEPSMSRRQMLRQSAAAAAGFAVGCQSGPEEGFTPLFNGKDLTGWQGDTLLWVVEDGMLIGRSPGISYNDFLTTEKSYGDFILRFKIQLVDNIGNTGVQFRSKRMSGSMEMIGYQADAGQTYWASLYDESRRRKVLAQADPMIIEQLDLTGWNDYEVYAKAEHIRLSINGKTTVDYHEPDDSIERTGLIATQVHSGPPLEVRFKDLRIKEI